LFAELVVTARESSNKYRITRFLLECECFTTRHVSACVFVRMRHNLYSLYLHLKSGRIQ